MDVCQCQGCFVDIDKHPETTALSLLGFASTSKSDSVVGARQNVNRRSAVCVCREEEEIQSPFSPDELKEAMKKIKEDLNPVSKDTDQQARKSNINLLVLCILVSCTVLLTADLSSLWSHTAH